MVTITHYEVYSQSSSNWRLEERFPADQRDRAFDLCKKMERKNIPVRIIRESFDVEENRYMESVEYVSGIANKSNKNKDSKAGGPQGKDKPPAKTDTVKKQVKPERQNIAGAIITIIAIILFCLVFANLFVTLLTPLVEEFVPEHKRETTLSVLFFCLFLLTAIPLVIRKVPWHVFDAAGFDSVIVNERRIYSYADTIIRRYHLNDDVDPSIAPTTPEAPIAYKRYIVEFLGQIVNNLGSRERMGSNYSKLGIKFVIFGGCLELSRKANLSITEANSLLYEAFQIMDGESVDVSAFYEAKRAYSENKAAMFLTGVGAYIMARLLKNRFFNSDILKKAFNRWEEQEASPYSSQSASSNSKRTEVLTQPFECVVNLQSIISKKDPFENIGDDTIAQAVKFIEDSLENLKKKYDGHDISQFDNIYSIKFTSLGNAFDFSIEFFKDFYKYSSDVNDENVSFDNKINILTLDDIYQEDSAELVADVFDNIYNEEILVRKEVKEKLEKSDYKFEFLGEKKLNRSNKTISLYKIVYQ